jgi:uncharacterized protein (DUF58 family)
MIQSLRNNLREKFIHWALRVRSPEPAPIILVQRRIYVLPSRAGLAFAAALVVILLGAMNYNLSLGHALVFLLVGLGIVNILHTFRNLALLSIRPGRCEPVFANGLARFDVLLENTRTEPRISLRLQIGDAAPVELDVGSSTVAVAPLTVPALQRGWLPLPRVTLETTWPLGLIRAWAYAVPDMRCLIYPAPATHAPPLPWGGDRARGPSREGRGTDDFSGLRTYQVSDAPRHVAWKAAARQQDGPLLTKLFSGASAEQCWLEWDALPIALDTEQRLAILARWMLDADKIGLAWGLRIPGHRLPPDNGEAHLATGLRTLALYRHGAN